MKKNAIRILSLFLVVMTLVGVISLPVSAYSYPMNYTITYKTKSGKVLGTNSGTVDGAAETRNALRITSPSYAGYALSNYKDSTVTGSMISWNFPASNYVRHGTGSYTVYYEPAYTATVRFLYGDSGRSAAGDKTATGKKGDQYYISSPRITGYTPNKYSVTGYFPSGDVSDTVYYYENTYAIAYNANGGSGAPANQVKSHFTPLKLSTQKPRRTGYTFLGWSTSSTATTATYSPGDTYTNNGRVTLYAVWASKTYTISYDANGGGGAPGSQRKTHDIKILIPTVEPVRNGYTFLGWGVSRTSTSPTYQPGEWYYSNISRTLYAVWQKNGPATYTVSYNANGGSGAPGSQTKTENVTLTLSPVSPRRTGYTFKGWATNKFMPGAQYQPGGRYTANASVTLYALWDCAHTTTEKQWSTGCAWKIVCKTCGATMSSGTTHGPYACGNWTYVNAAQHMRTKECGRGDYSTTEYASHRATTRYEQYSASQHRKYSHCTDCDTTIGSVSYENHTFTSSTSNGQVVSTCSLCGYTKTTAQTYTVSYNANGGSNTPASQTKVHGVTLTLSSTIPYRFNYEFLGWSTSSSATTATYTAGASYTGNASVTLYAVWKYKPATYTVSYDANGGTGAPGRQTKTYGVTLTLTTLIPTRRNYSFVGWSKDRNATSASYAAGGSYTDNADVTLYAVWRYDPETYTIRYDANDGTGAPASQTKTYGVPLTLSAVKPTRAGYEFLGWATSRNATTSEYAPGERYTDEAGVTLYAVWRYIPKTYEVKYDANGGGNTPARQTKTENVTLILTSTIPTRYGYTFRGWAINQTATTADYQSGGSYTANESVTLYAVWEINTYTVSFDANGGTNAPNPQKKTHGQNLILTVAIPTRPNHVFLGWATDSSAKSVAYAPGATYTAEEDVMLYAVWQERNYDFSVSNLTVTPDEIEQYGKVTVKFRVDNWDRKLPYANVPVEVLLNGEVIYSTTVNFSAYGVQNIVFGLNVGASLGTQTLVARINWADHESETRTGNNSTSATYAALGTIGHLRIDFGRSGEKFNCTWFDHANSEKNDSHFKESFDIFIDDLRTGVLKSRAEMRKFCYGKDECRNSHSYTEDCWGFRVLSDRYAYYIRCTPMAGDYECYIYAYDKIHLMEFLAEEKKLPEHCYSRLASTGEPILIRYAEKGYYPITLPEESTVEGMNESIGVTEAQRMAMETGSMFGWRVPGADPRNYEAKEQSKMKIAIYQINSDRDNERIAFVGLNSLERYRGSKDICPEIYDKVYEAEVDGTSLEDVYEKFNIDKPDDYKARSLSVSDVVEVIESDSVEPGFYFCDSIGFEKIDFDPDKTETVKNETIKVLMIEPEKKPYVKEIGSDLESLQHEVDGDIEAFYPTEDEVAFIVNEEGKINGLPLNRAIRNDDGVIIDIAAGNLMITGLGESDFASLDEERIKKYSERFRTPEMFLRVNGQLHVLPMPEPKPREKHGEER